MQECFQKTNLHTSHTQGTKKGFARRLVLAEPDSRELREPQPVAFL